MTKLKVLKIKIGEVFIEDKAYSVFQDAWEKKSKDDKVYYEIRTPVFVREIERKSNDKQPVETITA